MNIDTMGEGAGSYEPPAINILGGLDELTLAAKEIGGTDGQTFLGLEIGSV